MTRFSKLQDKPALTVEEVAYILGFTPATVRDMLKAGKIPGTLLGKAWYIRTSDFLEAFKPTNGFAPNGTIILTQKPDNPDAITSEHARAVREGKVIRYA
jgi:excisionase family DNA binding protein